MAGALFGLISGGVLGYAGQKHREGVEAKHEAELFAQKQFMDGINQRPDIIDNPEVQKQGKKLFPYTWEMMHPLFQAASADYKNTAATFAAVMNGAGAAPQTPGAAPGGPAPAPTPTMMKPPATMPATAITGPGRPGQPLGQGQGIPAAPAGPTASPVAAPQLDIGSIQKEIDRDTAALGNSGFSPEQRQAISARIASLGDRIKESDTRADRAESRADRQERAQQSQRNWEQGELDRRQARQSADMYRSASLQLTKGIQAAAQQENKNQHQFMDNMATEKNEEARQTQFNNVVGSLTKQSQHIDDMVRSATPPDPKSLDSAINDYNKNLRRAKQLGQRYKYDTTNLPDPKKRGQTPPRVSIGGYGLGGGKATVESDTSGAGADTSQDLAGLPPPPPGFKVAN